MTKRYFTSQISVILCMAKARLTCTWPYVMMTRRSDIGLQLVVPV